MDKFIERLKAVPVSQHVDYLACGLLSCLGRILAFTMALSVPLVAAKCDPREDARIAFTRGIEACNSYDYPTCNALLNEALTLAEEGFGSNHFIVGRILQSLGDAYRNQSRFQESEQVLRRAINIDEGAPNANSTQLIQSLNSLGNTLVTGEDRCVEAEALFKRALSIVQSAKKRDKDTIAVELNNIASTYGCQGRYAEQEATLKEILGMFAKQSSSRQLEGPLYNLGELYLDEGRFEEAQPLLLGLVNLRQKTSGTDSFQTAEAYQKLGRVFAAEHHYAEAETLFERTLAIYTPIWQQSGIIGPRVSAALRDLAWVYDETGRHAQALDAARRGVAILVKDMVPIATNPRMFSADQEIVRPYFYQLVHLLAADDNHASSQFINEAFQAAQYAQGLETARAVAGMTARLAAGSDALASLMREREDLFDRSRSLSAKISQTMSLSPDKRMNIEAALRQEQSAVDAKLSADETRLRTEFPRAAELSIPRPASIADIQSVLAPEEVFVAWSFPEDRKRIWTLPYKESYLFIIRKSDAAFFKLDLTSAEVTDRVQSLRVALTNDGAFDLIKANQLYTKLLGPAEALVVNATHLIVVPDRGLQSLPLSLLVTSTPAELSSKPSDYKKAAWLIRRQAVSVFPAPSSLVALRRFGGTKQATDPFIGFGDPDLKGEGSTRGITAAGLYRGAEVNLDNLRRLPRLPETAGELRAEAKALGASDQRLYLGSNASVTTVARLNLANTRVISFATHGLIAGDLPKLAEPALVLTPPANPSDTDDGLLRASQVTQLKLNADFVILSACNTAASDGRPGAEGLSGLAKAFFYAGARSLLVSHWPVDSDATVKLTTGLINATVKDPSIGRAEALRRSILTMIDEAPDNSDDANPSNWAPFILAGEGGARR